MRYSPSAWMIRAPGAVPGGSGSLLPAGSRSMRMPCGVSRGTKRAVNGVSARSGSFQRRSFMGVPEGVAQYGPIAPTSPGST